MSMPNAQRIVVCCGGSDAAGSVDDALRVGQALIARGHAVAFILADPARLVNHAGGWAPTDLFQAPARRPMPKLVLGKAPPDGLADAIALLGFDDKQVLLTLARMWDRLFSLLRPDVVLGFNAPLAWLVGPGHGRTFVMGNGQSLPPVVDTGFPRLRASSTPLAEEELLLDNANAALSLLGHRSLASLADLVGRCDAMLYGAPAFDPYLAYRRTATVGLLGAPTEPVIPPAKPRLMAVIDAHCPGAETVVLALAGYGHTPTDVWLGDAPVGMLRFLGHQPHIRLWDDRAAMLGQAPASSVLVHHGEQDVGERALALGRPQFVIPWTAEQTVFLQQARPMGFTWEKLPGVAVEELAGAFRAVLEDHSLVTSAQHHARQLSGMNLPNALPIIVERIEAAAAGN